MTRRLSYAAAAAELGIKESWLRGNIRKLPHTKVGRKVWFTDADLERIDQLFHIEPESGPLASSAPVPSASAGHPLAALVPLPARGRRAS